MKWYLPYRTNFKKRTDHIIGSVQLSMIYCCYAAVLWKSPRQGTCQNKISTSVLILELHKMHYCRQAVAIIQSDESDIDKETKCFAARKSLRTRQ